MLQRSRPAVTGRARGMSATNYDVQCVAESGFSLWMRGRFRDSAEADIRFKLKPTVTVFNLMAASNYSLTFVA